MRRRPVPALAFLLFLALVAPGAGAETESREPPELLPVPHPALERMEEGVRERLRAEREVLDRYLERESSNPETLGLAFAAMGQLYQVYDLSRPAVACLENARRLQPTDYRWPYHLGVLHQLDGELESARARLLEAASLSPGDLPTRIRLGQVLTDLDELDQAGEAFREVLAADAESAAAHYGLGRILYARGDLEGAIRHLETALELQPGADSIHHLLGMAYRGSGDLDQAREHLARNRHTPVSFPDPLVKALVPLVQGGQRLFTAGVEALRRKDYEAAAGHFRDSLAINPRNALSHYNLGLTLVALGRRAEAEAELRRSIELDPDYAYAHYNLGTLLAEDGRLEEASRHFRTAHELDPADPEAHLEWAISLAAHGDERRAAEELENVLAGSASLQQKARAHLVLGQLADRRGEIGQALEHYRGAAEADPGSAQNQLAWGAALGRAGRFSEAAVAYERALQYSPQDPEVHYGRAMALVLAAEYTAARDALEVGLEALPENTPLTHLLARLLATCPDPEIRDGDEALALARRVFGLQQSADHAETVAMALAELDRFDEAVEWQRRTIERLEGIGDGRAAAPARQRLALYQGRQPVRAPWRDGD